MSKFWIYCVPVASQGVFNPSYSYNGSTALTLAIQATTSGSTSFIYAGSLQLTIAIAATTQGPTVPFVVIPEPVYFTTLWREDERMLTAANQQWSVTEGIPEAYSIMAPPPLELQLSPVPQVDGQLEMLTVRSTTIDPANTATIIPIPDDLTPAIVWGALADLLGKDGIARDPVRANYCEQRYRQYVALAKNMPVVIHSEINGNPLIAETLQEIDTAKPNWESITADARNPVSELILASRYLIALSSVPDGQYSVTLDVVRKAPTYQDFEFVQIGSEQLDMIMEYAEHLALFKVGGAEWHATERQAQNFLLQAINYNRRIAAAARASVSASMQSERQKQGIPRMSTGSPIGVGAVKTDGQNNA